MDDLQFRRTVYADPKCTDEEVLKAAANDPAKQEFWDELKRLDAQMQQACKVDVPEGLAERLILRQSIQSHAKEKRRTRVHLALAASVLFVFGVSFTLFQQQNTVVNLSDHALAHVYYEGDGYALRVDGDENLSTVNAKLASIGGQITDSIGRIYYANFCNFDRVRSFHMVMQGDQGKVTVFVIPDNDLHVPVETFTDGKMHGEMVQMNNTRLVLVAQQGQSFDQLKSKLKKQMLFSA